MARFLPAVFAACALLPFIARAAQAADAPPNVVLVMTDDQGYGDLACHGNPVIKTPNLDQLHGESIRLTDYHVSPTCSPTRAALMTGHWTNRTGAWHTIMGRSLLRKNEVTMGQIFSDAGYTTAMFGKWHLGDNYPFRPEDRGFQEVMRHGGGGVGQTPDFFDNAYFDGSYWHNGQVTPVEGFCTDVWFDYAKRFIEANKGGDKPFFAYIATNAPHGPYHSPEDYIALYPDMNAGVASFLGMISNIDTNVGKLREYLRESGLEDNTIFIFTTDNGTANGDKVYNADMRGKKGSAYDGGHRVPFFIYWPNGKLTGGRDVETITAHVDILPTLIDLCGLPFPADLKFDGRSIRPLLEGTAKDWPDRILVTDSQRVRDPIKWKDCSVMTQQWRMINGKQLFDMNADPSQKNDVADLYPEEMKRLTDFYEAWWADISPSFAEDCEIMLGNPKDNPARLTCHDWIADGLTPWNQSHIRKAVNDPDSFGFWNVDVTEAGDYEIELRRWPEETDTAITAGMEPGEDVPGVPAYRTTPGVAFPATKAWLKIGGQELTLPVEEGAKGVTFKLSLETGPDELWAKFLDAEGKELGAYYAYVKKL